MSNHAEACAAEVTELHRFFVEWMTAAVPRRAEVFSRAGNVFAPEFLIVSPRGSATARGQLIIELEGAHGARPGFEIWIENYQCRRVLGDLCLVTYEEWQRLNGETTGRLSSALFRRQDAAPNGVEWLHVHETWLPGKAPRDA